MSGQGSFFPGSGLQDWAVLVPRQGAVEHLSLGPHVLSIITVCVQPGPCMPEPWGSRIQSFQVIQAQAEAWWCISAADQRTAEGSKP